MYIPRCLRWGDYPPTESIGTRLLPHPVPKEWHEFIRQNTPAYDRDITPCSKGLGIIPEHSGAVMENGVRVWKKYENYDSDASAFIPLGEACEDEGFVYKGKVGRAESKLFDMKTAVDFGTDWILKNHTK